MACLRPKMDKITKYFPRKRSLEVSSEDEESTPSKSETDREPTPQGPSKVISKSAKSKVNYRHRLSYRKEWDKTYPWVYCDSPVTGMFCNICQKYGKPPVTARGAWTSRGVTDWNHATELLKLHKQSKWHQDGVITARMAEQAQHTGSVIELHLAASAKQIEEERQHNRCVLLKLL